MQIFIKNSKVTIQETPGTSVSRANIQRTLNEKTNNFANDLLKGAEKVREVIIKEMEVTPACREAEKRRRCQEIAIDMMMQLSNESFFSQRQKSVDTSPECQA